MWFKSMYKIVLIKLSIATLTLTYVKLMTGSIVKRHKRIREHYQLEHDRGQKNESGQYLWLILRTRKSQWKSTAAVANSLDQ